MQRLPQADYVLRSSTPHSLDVALTKLVRDYTRCALQSTDPWTNRWTGA